MRASLIALSPMLCLLLAGCTPVPGGLGESEECVGNTAPEIGNLEVNSWQDEETQQWSFCVHVDWIDPGRDDAGVAGTGAPNIFGGMWSMEILGVTTPSSWIDENPSPFGVTLGANSGELERCYFGDFLVEDRDINFEVRVRDRCDAVSNEKSGNYYIGGGGAEAHQVENPGVGGDGCNPVTWVGAGAPGCTSSGE